jgi:hypothetical protein
VLSASENEAVSGVGLHLFSAEKGEFACPTLSEGPSSIAGATPVCAVQTDDTGVFELNGVPCGVYELRAVFEDQHTVFELEPASVQALVGHGTLQLAEPFRVVGFTASGRVTDSSGEPITNVDILLNGNVITATDSDG